MPIEPGTADFYFKKCALVGPPQDGERHPENADRFAPKSGKAGVSNLLRKPREKTN